MRRSDWLLLLIALEAHAAPEGLDPVRVQKGLFLLGERASLPAAERYDFVAYNYGPMSTGVYRDVRSLLARGLIERRAVPGYSWGRLLAVPAGLRRADSLTAAHRNDPPARSIACLREIKRTIVALSFDELLRGIYASHPEYARRSVFAPRSAPHTR